MSDQSEIRNVYESDELYAPSRICLKPTENPHSYTDRLLADRIALVRRYYVGGRVLDLCSATGEHLLAFAPEIEEGVGLDFSTRYVESARAETVRRKIVNIQFVQGDAKTMPFANSALGLVYSFSALYAIPGVEGVVDEIGRVLAPGGHAVLDFGNRRSLNTYCLRYYTDWQETYPITLKEIHESLHRNRLQIVEHRCFQLLPLWAGLPKHLWPLLHPFWREFLRRRLAGRMLDEWISSLPGLRQFAFRHLIVCRKVDTADAVIGGT